MLPYVANRPDLWTGTSLGAHSHREGNRQGIMHDCAPVQRLFLLVHGRTGSEVVNLIQHGLSGSEVVYFALHGLSGSEVEYLTQHGLSGSEVVLVAEHGPAGSEVPILYF